MRRAIEQATAQRRALPPGGVVPDDYRFEEASDGGEVRFSELFDTSKDTLVIYSFMFPRYSGDTRPGPRGGETAKLPVAETPCASCTSILSILYSLDGAVLHLGRLLNLVVVAKSDLDRVRNFARESEWRPGAEGRISHLKRGYGLRRSRLKDEGHQIWEGWATFTYNTDTYITLA